VALRAAIQGRGLLEPAERDLRLSASGERFFAGLGIDVNELHKRRRHFARACLDWSERQPHPAGALGAALMDQFVTRDWVSRRRNDRAVHVTAAGRRGLRRWFGLDGRGRQRGGAAMTADEACLQSARRGAGHSLDRRLEHRRALYASHRRRRLDASRLVWRLRRVVHRRHRAVAGHAS
jgi:hypothetical protein